MYNKQLVDLNGPTKCLNYYNDIDLFLKNDVSVKENWRADFWIRVHNLKDDRDFIDTVDLNSLNKFKEVNDSWKDILNEFTHTFDSNLRFLDAPLKNTKELRKYFDEYNDGNASERIVKEMEKLC
jgi:hypothetical protein